MKSLVWPTLSAATVVAIVGMAAAQQQSTQDRNFEADLTGFVQQQFYHGVPYGESQRFGPRAVPHLAALLGQEGMRPHWRSIVQVLNFSGSPEAFPVLREFIVSRFSGEIDSETRLAISAAIVTMGPLARISPAAMQFLSRGVNPSEWKTLRWTSERFSGEVRNLYLSETCMNALASSGTKEADRVFAELIRNGSRNAHWSELESMVLEFKAANLDIIQEGFENQRKRRDEYFAKTGGAKRE